jgi:acyl-CoA reductase-like NAD-dependent aldehyde dehydrogenase
VCESGTRLLIPESIHDEFVEKLVARARQIKVGDPMDHESDLGPLVSAAQLETVENYVRIGKEEGATLACGGNRVIAEGLEDGYYFEPTIFTGVDNSMAIAQEEIFGPVLCVIPFKDDDDAIRIANDTIYGLASGVWSTDPDRIMETAKRLRAGTVWINDFHLINSIAPFGGYKQSGLGREHSSYGLNEYTEVKHVHWDLGTPKDRKLFGVLLSE